MSSIILALLAATTVYRLELTDNKPYIVGADGVKREVAIVDPDQYSLMTGQVAQVWKSLHKDEDGRMKMHGKRVSQEIDAANGVKTTVYEDGYRNVERFETKTKKTMEEFSGQKAESRPNMSERQRRMRELLSARKSGKVKEVTLEHDAATGKDVVK